jgi:hypothetical protein
MMFKPPFEPMRLVTEPVRLRSGYFTNEGLADIDADIIVMTDYLVGELLDDDRAAFEQRLEKDAEFFEKVFPLMMWWAEAREHGVRAPAPSRFTRARKRAYQGIRRLVPSHATMKLMFHAAGIIAIVVPMSMALLARSTEEVLGVVGGMHRPRVTKSGDGSRSLQVPGGVVVTLSPHTRVTSDDWHVPFTVVRLAVEGNAKLIVGRGSHARVQVGSKTWEIGAGQFAVTDSTGGHVTALEEKHP